jgi:hypothetical protein
MPLLYQRSASCKAKELNSSKEKSLSAVIHTTGSGLASASAAHLITYAATLLLATWVAMASISAGDRQS